MNQLIVTDITNIGDPFILVHQGVYYHYSTSSKDGFVVYTSTNLKDWRSRGLCYHVSNVGVSDFWAPEVYFYNKKFYMFFSSKNERCDRLMITVAISESPLGPFIDVKDDHVFDFGYAAIDPHVFFDTNGSIYMYYAKDCSENIVDGVHVSEIYGVELADDLLHIKGEPKKLLSPSGEHEEGHGDWKWNEGPFMLKHDGVYYLSYSSNFFQDKEYCVNYAKGSNPLGSFKKAKENPILKYIPNKISGPGHNSYFKTRDNRFMTAFHIHTDRFNPSGDRRTCLCPYRIEDNKLIIDYK